MVQLQLSAALAVAGSIKAHDMSQKRLSRCVCVRHSFFVYVHYYLIGLHVSVII